ncbi:hypothetical protein ACIQWR_40990 [Streptomyces sp. NPDC098789]|uniref:hypothetical protein n=1 Tax=Streptomyces sp. NPDC098789 TaxID=3366098 RepID=UPI00382EA075
MTKEIGAPPGIHYYSLDFWRNKMEPTSASTSAGKNQPSEEPKYGALLNTVPPMDQVAAGDFIRIVMDLFPRSVPMKWIKVSLPYGDTETDLTAEKNAGRFKTSLGTDTFPDNKTPRWKIEDPKKVDSRYVITIEPAQQEKEKTNRLSLVLTDVELNDKKGTAVIKVEFQPVNGASTTEELKVTKQEKGFYLGDLQPLGNKGQFLAESPIHLTWTARGVQSPFTLAWEGQTVEIASDQRCYPPANSPKPPLTIIKDTKFKLTVKKPGTTEPAAKEVTLQVADPTVEYENLTATTLAYPLEPTATRGYYLSKPLEIVTPSYGYITVTLEPYTRLSGIFPPTANAKAPHSPAATLEIATPGTKSVKTPFASNGAPFTFFAPEKTKLTLTPLDTKAPPLKDCFTTFPHATVTWSGGTSPLAFPSQEGFTFPRYHIIPFLEAYTHDYSKEVYSHGEVAYRGMMGSMKAWYAEYAAHEAFLKADGIQDFELPGGKYSISLRADRYLIFCGLEDDRTLKVSWARKGEDWIEKVKSKSKPERVQMKEPITTVVLANTTKDDSPRNFTAEESIQGAALNEGGDVNWRKKFPDHALLPPGFLYIKDRSRSKVGNAWNFLLVTGFEAWISSHLKEKIRFKPHAFAVISDAGSSKEYVITETYGADVRIPFLVGWDFARNNDNDASKRRKDVSLKPAKVSGSYGGYGIMNAEFTEERHGISEGHKFAPTGTSPIELGTPYAFIINPDDTMVWRYDKKKIDWENGEEVRMGWMRATKDGWVDGAKISAPAGG